MPIGIVINTRKCSQSFQVLFLFPYVWPISIISILCSIIVFISLCPRHGMINLININTINNIACSNTTTYSIGFSIFTATTNVATPSIDFIVTIIPTRILKNYSRSLTFTRRTNVSSLCNTAFTPTYHVTCVTIIITSYFSTFLRRKIWIQQIQIII